MKAGDTFRPVKFDNHLWIIISDPLMDADKIVITNLTTNTRDEEQHCILKVGDHPFVTDNSAVRYRDAKVVSATDLGILIKAKQLKPNEPMSGDILKRIRDGATKSEHIPDGCREILEEQLPI